MLFCTQALQEYACTKICLETPSWYQEDWWKSIKHKQCRPEIMKQAVNDSLAIVPRGFFPLDNDSAVTIRMVR